MKKRNEPIPVVRSYMPSKEAYSDLLQTVWDSRLLTNNAALHNILESQLCTRLQVDDLVLFSNGHLALDSALRVLSLQGEVITTPFTFLSTVNAIVMNGLTPVFCDVRRDDFTMDASKIEALITERTCAIVPVHVYGTPCDCAAIERIAHKYHLKVVYDAAHAFGVQVDGRGIGSFGDCTMFSFHATKVFHTVEGGGVAFADPALRRKLMSAKNFGLTGPESAQTVGLNAKMSEFHAAMGLLNLETVDWQIQQRKHLVDCYRRGLDGLPGVEYLRAEKPGVTANYAYFPVVFDERACGVSRDEICMRLKDDYNILARRYFSPLISELESFRGRFGDASSTPAAKYLSDRVLTLPLYVELTEDDVAYIVAALREILTGSARG